MRLSLIFFIIFSLISFSFEITREQCKSRYDYCLSYQPINIRDYEVHKRNCQREYQRCLKYATN